MNRMAGNSPIQSMLFVRKPCKREFPIQLLSQNATNEAANKVTDLESFTNFLFEGLILALEPFGIPKNEIQKIQEIVKKRF